ncbi:MAG: ABC transporter permease [Alphaproteobacteria bacterium]|nr:ABC transporter permease [Alphaproteobacteria bacterium]
MISTRSIAGALPLLLLFVAPLVASLAFMGEDALSGPAWVALLAHPQLAGGLALSFFTATVSSLLALVLALLIAAAHHERGALPRGLSAMLAVPHLAFALGLGFLIMPSGLVARVIAVLFTGWASPPEWRSSHDPYGLALIVALVAKETVFLVFTLAGALARADLRSSFAAQGAAAAALGHGGFSIWLRLFLPQLYLHLRWPVVVVFVYAATVVDMSLVIGPTQPPTFAVVVWSDINSPHVADAARGGAGAVFLALLCGTALAAFWAGLRALAPALKRFATRGPSARAFPRWIGLAKWAALRLLFLVVIVTLVLLSLAALWPFPQLWPDQLDTTAWGAVARQPGPLLTSLGLALGTSVLGLIALVLWLELTPRQADRLVVALSVAMLGLPALLVGLGQYRLFLRLGLTGTGLGLFLAHLMPVTAYMAIMLIGPYRAVDPRWHEVSASLGAGERRFLARVKWPLLRAPLASAAAVGFAVSFAQFISAQLVAAGRFSTLPMEAVTLASGVNRPLTAAFGLLLMAPPLLVFLLAGLAARPRWSGA